jgi:hypothetical protein
VSISQQNFVFETEQKLKIMNYMIVCIKVYKGSGSNKYIISIKSNTFWLTTDTFFPLHKCNQHFEKKFADVQNSWREKTLSNRDRAMTTWAARWFVFKPKIPIWVSFGGSCDGRCWYILEPFGIFNGFWV